MLWNPKDKNIINILNNLQKNQNDITSYKLAKQISRYKQIRYLRKNNELYIGNDRKKSKSIIVITKPIFKSKKGFKL